jgi:hypothetical protein
MKTYSENQDLLQAIRFELLKPVVNVELITTLVPKMNPASMTDDVFHRCKELGLLNHPCMASDVAWRDNTPVGDLATLCDTLRLIKIPYDISKETSASGWIYVLDLEDVAATFTSEGAFISFHNH